MEVQGCSENGTHSRIRLGLCHKEFSWRDLFSSGGFHVPCDLLTSQGQNDLPFLEGMVAEFWFMHLKMLLPSSPTM
jgi:hypothetical protein